MSPPPLTSTPVTATGTTSVAPPLALTADAAPPESVTPRGSPARAANTARNAQASWLRAGRWRFARAALWQLLDRHVQSGNRVVQSGNRVAVVGAGNGDTVPLRQLAQRAGLIDLDEAALTRARRRLTTRSNLLNMIVSDVTFGRADAIAHATIHHATPPPDWPRPDPTGAYDVVIADLLFTQLFYPALSDAHLPTRGIDQTLQTHGQPLRRRRCVAARQRPRRSRRSRPRPTRLVAQPPTAIHHR